MGGISGTAKDGADSIVLSGGYEDDVDYGDEIVYTGHGGRHPSNGQQMILPPPKPKAAIRRAKHLFVDGHDGPTLSMQNQSLLR